MGKDKYSNKRNINFDCLPVDVLLVICDLLDFKSLVALGCTCQRLYNIIYKEYLNKRCFSLVATNQFSKNVQHRSLHLLTPLEKYRTHLRWTQLSYNEHIFLKSREKFQPWLSLKQNSLFIARGPDVYLFRRTNNGISARPIMSFRGHLDDISRFIVRGNVMISSCNDGTLHYWDTDSGKISFSCFNDVNWNERVYVDWSGQTLAVGFHKLGCVRFLSLGENNFKFERHIVQDDRVWSVALNNDGTTCCIGSAGYQSPPLQIYDLHKDAVTLAVPQKFKLGAGVFHAVWETPNLLVSGSFDTYIRLWDLRIGTCVRAWSDPYDSAIYTIATDNHCTILAGTARHGRVTLWDKRQRHCVQKYYMLAEGPVYSLDFDPYYMFVGLESSLNVLNFKTAQRRPNITRF